MHYNKHIAIMILMSLFLIFPKMINTVFISIMRPIIFIIMYSMLSTFAINTLIQYFYYSNSFKDSLIIAVKNTVDAYIGIAAILISIMNSFLNNKK